MNAPVIVIDGATGDGKSTLTQGIISAVNETAHRLGVRVRETAPSAARNAAGEI